MKNFLKQADTVLKFLVKFKGAKSFRTVSTYSVCSTLKSKALPLSSSRSILNNNVSILGSICSISPTNYYATRCYSTSDDDSDKEQDKLFKQKKKSSKQQITDTEANRLIQTMTQDFEKNLETGIADSEQFTVSNKDSIAPSFKEHFKVFRDEDATEILDIHEIAPKQMTDDVELVSIDDDIEYSVYQQKTTEKFDGLNLTRGETGVFDIEELVDVLNQENAKDICVIKVPQELHYCDYLVLTSAVSLRHLNSIMEFIRKLYKRKKDDTDEIVNIEGRDSKNWKILDMKNIVLHVFMPETRSIYDLESLWTLGAQYDDLIQRPPQDEVFDEILSYTQYFEDRRPQNETEVK